MTRRHVVNLALQGGGALGALTWGILDRLLEEPWLEFEGISGSSAGAMNGVALAAGMAQGGRAGARELLDKFWNAVGTASYPAPLRFGETPPDGPAATSLASSLAAPAKFLIGLTRFFSPYQLNPLDLNPLRQIVDELIDFERLRAASPLQLFIGATHVRSGTLRLFERFELSTDHLLASACLPAISQAVVIDGEAYWDGGYAGNPAIYPLLYRCRSRDVVIVLLLPLERDPAPTSAEGIRARITEIHLNSSFLREMRGIGQAQAQVARVAWLRGPLERRLAASCFHMVATDDLVSGLAIEKSLNTSLPFLVKLKAEGRERAATWLARHGDALGRHSTIDVQAMFGSERRPARTGQR